MAKMISIEPGLDDGLAILLCVLAVSGYYLSKHLSNPIDIPDNYWYVVPQLENAVATSREKKARTRDISIAWEQKNLDLVVFWGSQSGRAESLAKSFATFVERFGLRVLVCDLADYSQTTIVKLGPSQPCAFFLSTYGDGDPSDNTNGLWDDVRTFRQSGTSLANLRYLVFGLGSSKYRQYNNVAETIDRQFQLLGAKRYGELGRGDDANGSTEDDFLMWRGRIIDVLGSVMKLDKPRDIWRPAFKITEVNNVSDKPVHHGEPHPSLLPQRSSQRTQARAGVPQALQVLRTQRLWETPDRVCVHFDIDLGADRSTKYKTGDHLAIWPINPDDEVDRLVAVLDMETKRDTLVSIESTAEGAASFPRSPTTPHNLFRYYVEIAGTLSREMISTLGPFAPSEEARAELNRLSAEPAVFRNEIVDRKCTLPDLLETVGKGAKWAIPLSFLIERLKSMQPRYYSISSSALAFPGTASITAVIDKRPAELKSGCYGLATGYLHAIDESMQSKPSWSRAQAYALDGPRNLLAGHKTFAHIRQSTFKLPFKASTPIIMIGCGTGVAPFRAFVQERLRLKKLGHDIGRMMLFMGFRRSDEDYIYRDEWLKAQNELDDGVLEICTAFSRDRPQKKFYVQDRLKDKAGEVLQILDQFGSRMYICGSADMARDVSATLAALRVEATGEGEEAVNAWMKKLRSSKQLFEDVWS